MEVAMSREKVEARERQLASPIGTTICTKGNIKRSARWQQLSRANAWSRILDAVAEQREALDFRLWLADPNDTHLQADVQIWCALTGALTDLLEARRAA
jgi:hypothetical protein